MDMGSDVGAPLTGTRISIWPLPKKAKAHVPGTPLQQAVRMAESRYLWKQHSQLVSRWFLLPDNQPTSDFTACRLRKPFPAYLQINELLRDNRALGPDYLVITHLSASIYGTPALRKRLACASAERASGRRFNPFRASPLRCQLSGSSGRR
jgi:hypothetical protein